MHDALSFLNGNNPGDKPGETLTLFAENMVGRGAAGSLWLLVRSVFSPG